MPLPAVSTVCITGFILLSFLIFLTSLKVLINLADNFHLFVFQSLLCHFASVKY